MSTSCKVIAIVSVLYLTSGVIHMIVHPGIAAVAQLAYVACSMVGALAAVAGFSGPPRRYRALALWSIAPLIPVIRAGDWRIFFPGVPSFHLVIPLGWASQQVFLGVDGAPLLLAALIWAFTDRLIKARQADAATPRS